LTETGKAALEDYRDELRAVLGDYLADISDEQVEALATATETLAQLIDLLQVRPTRGAARIVKQER
jgi:DNA-binding MarR family transcriptional regulator